LTPLRKRLKIKKFGGCAPSPGGISNVVVVAGGLALGLVAALALGLSAQGRAFAQAKAVKPEKVRFESFDHVELHGSFYPSQAGGTAPCVLILHAVGGNREQEGWDALAQKLLEHYAVMIFDFRGHGDSTDVLPGATGFWADPNNRVLGSNPNKKTISFKDFPKSYLPMLVNDIAAARHFLDLQSNAGRCNSSNIILLGEKDGAALGALWLTTEWQRRPPVRGPFGPIPAPANTVGEGKDVACGVWLSISPTLGSRRMPYVDLFTKKSPEVKEKVPMYFIYGEKDTVAKDLSQLLNDQLKRGNKNPKIAKLTGTRTIAKTNLSGRQLLKESLGTDKNISDYIEKVLDERGVNPPEKRNLDKMPTSIPIARFIQ